MKKILVDVPAKKLPPTPGKEIPAKVLTQWGCGIGACKYVNPSQKQVREHQADKHSYSEHKELWGIDMSEAPEGVELFLFKTEIRFNRYTRKYSSYESWNCCKWSGPGWYALVSGGEDDQFWICMEPIKDLLDSERARVNALLRWVSELERIPAYVAPRDETEPPEVTQEQS